MEKLNSEASNGIQSLPLGAQRYKPQLALTINNNTAHKCSKANIRDQILNSLPSNRRSGINKKMRDTVVNTTSFKIYRTSGDGPVRLGGLLMLLLLLQLAMCGEGFIREGNTVSPQWDHYHPRTPPSPLPPQFDPSQSGNVTALAGKTALLNCRVHHAENLSVSWVRHRDIHLLTVGPYTYTSDQRFRVVHERDSDDWVLKISYVQPRDSGVYECQVSTTPPTSHFVGLNVVEPKTTILGGPDIHINTGSTINLTCVIQFSPEPPEFIFWNHNHKIIGYDSPRGGVTVIIEKGDETICTLLIQRAQNSDSGRYDCNPSNAAPANISVHVLNGEQPAAIQHGGKANYSCSSGTILALILFLAAYHSMVTLLRS